MKNLTKYIIKFLIINLFVTNLFASDKEILNDFLLTKYLDVVQKNFAESIENHNSFANDLSKYPVANTKSTFGNELQSISKEYNLTKLPKLEFVKGSATFKMGGFELVISPSNYINQSFVLNGKTYSVPQYKSPKNLFEALKKEYNPSTSAKKVTSLSYFISEAFARETWIGNRVLASVVMTSSGVIYFNRPEYDCSTESTSIDRWTKFTDDVYQVLEIGIDKALKKCRNKEMPFDDSDQEYVANLMRKLNHNTDVTQANLITTLLSKNASPAKTLDWRNYWNDRIEKCEPAKNKNGSEGQESLVELIANTPLFSTAKKDGLAYQCSSILGMTYDMIEKGSPYWNFRKKFSSGICEPLKQLQNCIEEENMNIVCTVADLDRPFSKCYTPDATMRHMRRSANKTWIIEDKPRKRATGEAVGK